MKGKFIVFVTLVLTSTVLAAAAGGRVADVLIGVHVDGETRGWWNPGATYQNAFVAAGATVEVVYAPEGGAIPFPNPLTPGEYPVCVVLTSENWLAPPHNFGVAEEETLVDYCADGGAVMIVGQDLLYGVHNDWGYATGFFKNYMGLSYVIQDILETSESVSWTGEAGGPLDGKSGTTSSGDPWPPFEANICQTDELTPVPDANVLIRCSAGGFGPYATGIYYDRAEGRTLYRSCFVAYELAADTTNFSAVIEDLYTWLSEGETGIAPASLGELKAIYR